MKIPLSDFIEKILTTFEEEIEADIGLNKIQLELSKGTIRYLVSSEALPMLNGLDLLQNGDLSEASFLFYLGMRMSLAIQQNELEAIVEESTE